MPSEASLADEALPVSAFVVRREAFALIVRSRDIVAEAEAEAQALLSRAEAEAETERRRGHEEGLLAGQREAARLVADAASGVEEFLRAREAELVELALALALRVVGALPEQERMAGLVATALADYRSDVAVTLRTDPGGAASMRRAVRELDLERRVHVEAGAELQPGRCLLVHAGGQARVGLLDQFRAMMDAAGTGEPGA